MEDVRIITYNVHSCVGSDSQYSVERISQTLASQNPTIVCLQEIEVNSETERTRLWSHPHASDQPNEIAERLNMKHRRFAPAVRSRVLKGPFLSLKEEHDGPLGGEFGNAILSEYPILQTERHAYRPYKRKTSRNALACLIRLPNSVKIWIVTTHLGVHPTGAEQFQQAEELMEFVESLKTHDDGDNDIAGVVLCGDFNSLPWFRSVRVVKTAMAAGMKDAWIVDGNGGGGCTFPAAGLPLPCLGWVPPVFRLDYVFFKTKTTRLEEDDDGATDWIVLKRAFVVKNGRGANILASDHLPLCAVFVVKSF